MSKFARILEIDHNKALIGLLNDHGLCGTGSCEGCSCSTKMQTMKLTIPEDNDLQVGMDVEMKIPGSVMTDWILLIIVPVLLTIGTVILLQSSGIPENTRNLAALGTGTGGFLLSAVILKFMRRNQIINLEKI